MSFVVVPAVIRIQSVVAVGKLFGTTKVAGLPDSPVRRRVQIVQAGQNAHGLAFPTLGSTISWKWAGNDGAWQFDGLDPGLKYHVIAYDHTGVHDPVIKLNLVPTVD